MRSTGRSSDNAGGIRDGIPAPGYSRQINNPEILAAMKKSRGISNALGILIVPLPLLGFMIYAGVTGDMEPGAAFRNGAIVSLVFLFFMIRSSLSGRAEKSYEAVVTDKQILRRGGSSSRDDADTREEYVTYIRTTDGRNKKIVENPVLKCSAWHYLEVGDRFKYHPQLHFPYEKYDKSHDSQIWCVGCLKANPIGADRCGRCNLPLLK